MAADAHSRTGDGSSTVTPWGTDPLGESFGSRFLPVSQQLNEAFDCLTSLFDSVSDRLELTSRALVAAEDHATVLANDLLTSY
jgi:hypothetical protein